MLSNWEERSFAFNEDEYKLGIDVPDLGYGGKRRNISKIIDQLQQHNDLYLIEADKL